MNLLTNNNLILLQIKVNYQNNYISKKKTLYMKYKIAKHKNKNQILVL